MSEADGRFVELYEEFFRRIHGYFIRRIERDRVDDAVAETFLVAWRRIHDVPNGDEALPWLYGVAYRVLGNQRRTVRRRHNLNDRLIEIGIHPLSSPEEAVVANEESRLVLLALSKLKNTDQEILRLSMWEEIDHTACSCVLGISPGAVKQRLYEARKNLTREYNRLENRRAKTPAAQKGGGQ